MSRKATVPMLAAIALAAPLLGWSVTAASAADKGLISIIVIDPANLYWLTEGKVAAAEAEKLGYRATVGATKADTNVEMRPLSAADAVVTDHPSSGAASAMAASIGTVAFLDIYVFLFLVSDWTGQPAVFSRAASAFRPEPPCC